MSESQGAVLSLSPCPSCAKALSLSAPSPCVKSVPTKTGAPSPFQGETGVCGLSHAAVLLPGLVRYGGVRGVQGRSQGAQEAGQQREAQSTPRAKHGPAVTVADVLRYAEHVARVAGQFEVDPRHTRAKGDYAARPCQRERDRNQRQT